MQETIKTLAGVLSGAVGLVVVLTFFFLTEKVKTERSLIDVTTHCPLERPIKVWGMYEVRPPDGLRRTAVVIDATDQIPSTHRNLIADWFKRDFTNTLLRFERVAIYEVRPEENSPDPLLGKAHFDQCAPPNVANKWIENPRFVRKQFEQEFMYKMLSVIESLASQSEAQWSPIVEVVEELFKEYDRIILISDLMQNTPGCSLYQKLDNLSDKRNCRLLSHVSFEEKSMVVIFLKRKGIQTLQGDSLLNFWPKYIEGKRGSFLLETELPIIK